MEVFTIESIIHPVLNPESLLCPLTFRTMTVATAIVTYPLLTAGVAIDVSAKCRSTTFLKGIKSTYHKTIGMTPFNILLSKPIYDLSNFKLRTWHYF